VGSTKLQIFKNNLDVFSSLKCFKREEIFAVKYFKEEKSENDMNQTICNICKRVIPYHPSVHMHRNIRYDACVPMGERYVW
jgi:hypothetical protein